MARALITGASSGIGKSFCYKLASKGWDLVLVARRQPLMERLVREIHIKYNVECEIIRADLSHVEDIKTVAARLRDDEAPVDLLINNAGFATGQFFPEGQIEFEVDNLRVMVLAPMMLSHAAVQAMIPRGYGGIINVGSIASESAMGTYSAAKAWLKRFSESLHLDVKRYGIKVVCVQPGTVMTDFWDSMHVYPTSFAHTFTAVSKRTVVRESLWGLRLNMPRVVPSMRYRLLTIILKFMPRCAVNRIGHAVNMRRLHI